MTDVVWEEPYTLQWVAGREGLHKEWCPLRVLYGYGAFTIKGHESSLAKIATLYPRYKENSCYC